MNCRIVLNEGELDRFIEFLPDLNQGECFYISLLARKKYSNGKVKKDKKQLKRVIVSRKEDFKAKIRQLECDASHYGVPEESLAIYTMVNPRSFKKAFQMGLSLFAEIIVKEAWTKNPSSEIISCLQKSPSRKRIYEFDFDNANPDDYIPRFREIFPEHRPFNNVFSVVKTRGGFHLLIYRTLGMGDDWYRFVVDMKPDLHNSDGDIMIPIPGCTQGGYCPYFYPTCPL